MLRYLRKPFTYIIKFFRNVVNSLIKLYCLNLVFNFFGLKKEKEYCFVKKSSDFPHVKLGSDFDIYILNNSLVTNDLHDYLINRRIVNFEINQFSDTKLHLNLVANKTLILKLDFYISSLNSPIILKNKNLLIDTVKSSEKIVFRFLGKNFYLNFPLIMFDSLIRYIEFCMYPNKSHHINKVKKLDYKQKSDLEKLLLEYTNLNLKI